MSINFEISTNTEIFHAMVVECMNAIAHNDEKHIDIAFKYTMRIYGITDNFDIMASVKTVFVCDLMHTYEKMIKCGSTFTATRNAILTIVEEMIAMWFRANDIKITRS